MGKRKLKLQLREARACVNELLSQRNAQDATIREMAEEIERYESQDDEQINRLTEENRILRAQVARTFTSEEPQDRDDVQAAIAASEECKELVRGLWEAVKALSDAMVHKANAETVAKALEDQKDRTRAVENEVTEMRKHQDRDRASISVALSSVSDLERAMPSNGSERLVDIEQALTGLNRKLLTEEDERAQVQKLIDRMNQEMAEMRRLLVEMDKGFTGRLDADRASIAMAQASIIDIEQALAGVNLLVSADRETLAQHSLALADLKADIEQLRPATLPVVPRL